MTTIPDFSLCVRSSSCVSLRQYSFNIQIIMICLFSFLLLVTIGCLIRLAIKGTTFISKALFFILIFFFCLGRCIYFAFNLLQTEVHPQRHEALTILSELSFMWSSSFFYSAFSVLTINFSENLFFANGFSVIMAKNRTKLVKLSTLFFNIYIHACQIVLFVIMTVFMEKDKGKTNGPGANQLGSSISYVVQFCLDGSVSWIIVLFFSIWIAICTKNLWTDVLAKNEERSKHVTKLRIAAIIFCALLIMKGFANFILSIYQAECAWLCPTIQTIVFSFCSIAFDFAPLFIVVLIFSIRFSKRASTIESEPILVPTERNSYSTTDLALNHSDIYPRNHSYD